MTGRRLRILIVTQRFHPLIGGAERALLVLARGFLKRGHHVEAVAARFDRGWPSTALVEGVTVTRLPLPPIRFAGTATFVLALIRYLRHAARHIDVAYVSMLKHAAWATLQARRSTGTPVVLRAEGAGQTGDVAWQQGALLGRSIAGTCRHADAIVAVSRAVETELRSAGYSPRRIRLIPNAVDCNSFRPPTTEERETARRMLGVEGPLAVYVGRIAEEKGIDLLATAWGELTERVPGAMLLIVGGPVDSPLAVRLARNPAVRLVGETQNVRAVLHAADLFILPSRFEGISIALLEAMACGIPVVATDIPGNREALGDEPEGGLLVPPGNREQLVDAVARLLSAPELRAEMARQARRRVERCFSLERSLDRHLELFREVMARRSRD